MNPHEQKLRCCLLKGLSGDSRAYEEFLLELSALLRRYIRRSLERVNRPANDAEDIVQETLIAIHSRRHTYEPDLPVTAWAYAIARYKLIDWLRTTERDARALPFSELDTAVDTVGQVEAVISVRKCISALPEVLRLPIQLVKIDGFSPKEIAGRIGLQETTVRVNVHRGLKALAQLCGVERRPRDEN